MHCPVDPDELAPARRERIADAKASAAIRQHWRMVSEVLRAVGVRAGLQLLQAEPAIWRIFAWLPKADTGRTERFELSMLPNELPEALGWLLRFAGWRAAPEGDCPSPPFELALWGQVSACGYAWTTRAWESAEPAMPLAEHSVWKRCGAVMLSPARGQLAAVPMR